MTPFRRALPVTLTSFINKTGSIGLSIIPILLVEHHVSNERSAWISGAIRVAGLAGILAGGWSCDRLGLRITLLLSFAISGLGLAPLPFFNSALAIAALSCLAQLGTSLYPASARLLITQVVEPEDRREAIAWQRTANNLAQIFSYSLGALLSRFGTAFLFFFDAATSFAAAGVGARILPDAQVKTAAPVPPENQTRQSSRGDFYRCALVISAFAFFYDLYEVGAAARCKTLFGDDGLAVFSELMVINTVLCAGFSVLAAKHLTHAALALPVGLTLLIAGLMLTFSGIEQRWVFFVGSFVVTLGEIVFNSLAALVLIHLTPQGTRQGQTYSSGVFVQYLGRIFGSAAAFPLLIGSPHPLVFVAATGGPALIGALSARRLLASTEVLQ